MPVSKYKVRSGQNIYDVAMTLHGSVEGVFDLLVSNRWLNMETRLTPGTELDYHEEFAINRDIARWLGDNGVTVKNGDHTHSFLDLESVAREHIRGEHPGIHDSISAMSPDEKDNFFENLCRPRLVARQEGLLSAVRLSLKGSTHMIIDWGDYSPPQIAEGEEETEVEHCYKSGGIHRIVMYGDFELNMLDLSGINGAYYPLGAIYADRFVCSEGTDDFNKLIITQ